MLVLFLLDWDWLQDSFCEMVKEKKRCCNGQLEQKTSWNVHRGVVLNIAHT